jgi:hypothetical protein
VGRRRELRSKLTIRSKIRIFLRTVLRDPGEALDRTRNFLDSRTSCGPSSKMANYALQLSDGLARLTGLYGDASRLLEEPALCDVRAAIDREWKRLVGPGVFSGGHNADPILGDLCYVMCRLLRPSIVVETGVAYGVTTSHILAALAANGKGQLHSIDLPPLAPDSDRSVGRLVPLHLRARWKLHRGESARLLPRLLGVLPSVDLFVHDSLHTYRCIRNELECVTAFLANNSAVIVDDIQTNRAFDHWVERVHPREALCIQERCKPAVCGVAAFSRP